MSDMTGLGTIGTLLGIPGMQSLGMSKDSKGATPTSMEGIFKSLMGGQPGQGGSEQQLMMGLLGGLFGGGSLGAGQQGLAGLFGASPSQGAGLLGTVTGAGVAKLPNDNSIQNNRLEKAKQLYFEAEQKYKHSKYILDNFDKLGSMNGESGKISWTAIKDYKTCAKKDFSGIQDTEQREALQYLQSDGVFDEYDDAAGGNKDGHGIINHNRNNGNFGRADAEAMVSRNEKNMNEKKAEYEKLQAESNKKAPVKELSKEEKVKVS